MELLLIIILVAVAYFTFMFVLSPILIPHLGWKRDLKKDLPKNVQKKVREMTKSSKTKKELLKKILDYQLSNFKSSLNMVFTDFPGLFIHSTSKIWNKKKFLHCHQQNLVLRQLLLETGRFSDKDIRLNITACYFNIHQYLNINIGKKNIEWIATDPFAMSLGYKLGEILGFFCYTDMKKKNLNWKPNFIEYRKWKEKN